MGVRNMDKDRIGQEEHIEQTDEKKPELVWDNTGQGIYKETTHQNQGEYHQNSDSKDDNWQENFGQMGSEIYQPVSKGFGIASLVLGILSLVLYCTCINILLAVLAIIFGILQLVQKDSPKGMAIAGIVTSCLSILFFIISVVVFLSSTDLEEALDQGIENRIQQKFHIDVPYYNDDFFDGDYGDYDDSYNYDDDYDEDYNGPSDTF